MDLPGHELPLTFHFSRATQQARPRAALHKPSRGSQSATRPSKQSKNNVAVASSSSTTAGQSKPRQKTLQLPTPATSARKRVRPGESQDEMQPPNERCAMRKEAMPEPSSAALATPCTDRRKVVRPVAKGHTAETGIATPQSSSRGMSETMHGIDNHSPLARSSCRLSSRPSQVSSCLAGQGPTCSSIGSACSDPFYDHPENGACVSRDIAFAPSKECFSRSETVDGRLSNGHITPVIPVPSSQSQYLLHIDATPKRKRCYQRSERVGSSQTQEEAELTLPTPRKSARITGSFTMISPGQSGKHALRENSRGLRLGYDEQPSQRNSCFSLATKNAPEELAFKSPTLPRRSESSLRRSPDCNTDALNGFTRQDSIENVPPVLMEDSLTESESDSEVLWPKASDKRLILDPLLRNTNQVLPQSPVSRGELPGAEDDSATEAESDTEISRCIAEIGKKRGSDYPLEVSREHTPPPLVFSPLVSPAKSRTGTMPLDTSLTQIPALLDDGSRSSVSGNASCMDQSGTRLDSLPSVVRDFICMFPGDESYPADFPESLRI